MQNDRHTDGRVAQFASGSTRSRASPSTRSQPGTHESAVQDGRERGRSATHPLEVPARGWKDILFRVWKNIGKDRVIVVAAGVTFYSVLALFPDALKGALKRFGGSQFDDWNNILANQTLATLWLANSKKETRDRQYSATFAALVGISPKDEIEGMIAAQLLAAHNAAMECYRRAMIGESLAGVRA
jgi:hypothetical protein